MKVIVLAVVVIVVVEVISSALQTPVFRATAEVILRPHSTDTLFNPVTGQQADPTRAVATEIKVLESQPVRDAARKQLGALPAVSAAPAGQTDVINVSVRSTVPKRAADAANAYASAYIDLRRSQAINDMLAATQQIEGKVSDFQKQIDDLDARVNSAPAGQQADVRANIAPQRDALIAQQGAFKQKLDQLQVDAALSNGDAQLVTAATVPTTPVSPRPILSGLLALIVGLMVGVGLAFFVEYLDDSIKSKEDLGRIVQPVPVIGLIPLVTGWKPDGAPQVISRLDPRSAAAEAYRTLRTSIQFLALDRPMQVLQVTSASAEEGKTTTLANLAVALAQAGQRVVIVCCDLRRPRVHEFFGLDNEVGFTSVLLGQAPVAEVLQPVPGEPGLSVLASGPLPPNPAELLTSRRMVEVLTSLRAVADIVLVDSPPVLPVTDALVICGCVDATLVVAISRATSKKDAARAVELLQQVDAPIVGAVLNGVSGAGVYGYSYSYYHRENRPTKADERAESEVERESART